MKNRILSLTLALVLCLGLTVPVLAAEQTFSDVPSSHWVYTQIERAFAEGAINGTFYNAQTGERRFSPNGTVTMAQFVTILCRRFFPDQLAVSTATGKWYAQAQAVGLQNSIFSATTDGIRGMEKPLTRFNMAALICGVLGAIGCAPTEAEISAAASQIADYDKLISPIPVQVVVSQGIIQGIDAKGTFAGDRYMTRAQAAAVYCRLVDAVAEKQTALEQEASLRFNAPFDAPHIMQGGERDRIIGQHYMNGKRAGDGRNDSVFVSSDPSVVRVVRSDEIEAVGPGTAVITCTSHLYNILTTASCTITVGGSAQTTMPAQPTKPTETVVPTTPEKPTGNIDLPALRDEMLELVNAERAEEGLPALQLDERVCEYAQIRAAEVAEKFSHTRPNGENYWTELKRMGVVYYPGGENISAGEDNPADAVDGWMHSPGHRANILKEGIKGFAMGYVQVDSGYKHYWVQIFTGAASSESEPSSSTNRPTGGTSQNNGTSGGTSGSGSGSQVPDQGTSAVLTTDAAQSQLLNAINQERAKAGLSPLVLDARASEAAQVRAAEQISGTMLTRPDGRPFETALDEAGVAYQTACECIISGQGTSDKIMNAIMGYSRFRNDMLSEDFSEVGIGFTRNNTEWPYCSIIFYS